MAKKQKKNKRSPDFLISFCFNAFYYFFKIFLLVLFIFAAFTG